MNLVVFRTFTSAFDAHLAKSKLADEGIETFVFDENINTIHPLYNMATGGIKLMVKEGDFRLASMVFEEVEKIAYTDANNEVISCPNCNSNNVDNAFKSFKSLGGILSIIASFIFMVLPIYYRVLYRCKDCDMEFKR